MKAKWEGDVRAPLLSSEPASQCPAVPQVAQLPPHRCPAPPTSSAMGPGCAQVPLSSASPSGAWFFMGGLTHQGSGKATIRVRKTKLLLQTVPRGGGGGTARHLSLHLLPWFPWSASQRF